MVEYVNAVNSFAALQVSSLVGNGLNRDRSDCCDLPQLYQPRGKKSQILFDSLTRFGG